MSAETEKPAIKSTTIWGSVLQVLAVILAMAVAGIHENQGIIIDQIKVLLPSWAVTLATPAVTSVIGFLMTFFGRQNAAQTGKKIKGVF